MNAENRYYNENELARLAEAGNCRGVVGGMWEEIGKLQCDFLIREGLEPAHYLADIGCGCLRGGIKFIDYLNSGHYWGADISESLLDAGYKELIAHNLDSKLPRSHLLLIQSFDLSLIPCKVDFAIAQSVFTHLSLNHLRLCLFRLADITKPGSRFYATFFEIPEGPLHYSYSHGEITTFPDKDPFHYFRRDMEYAAVGTKWRPQYIGSWNHPRNQMMMCYVCVG